MTITTHHPISTALAILAVVWVLTMENGVLSWLGL